MEKIKALHQSNNNYEAFIKLKPYLVEDFVWWKSNIFKMVKPLRHSGFILEIFSDASISGWGAHSNGERIHGFWRINEREQHINVLELLAAFYGLICLAENLKDCNILLRIDITTAITYINHTVLRVKN